MALLVLTLAAPANGDADVAPGQNSFDTWGASKHQGSLDEAAVGETNTAAIDTESAVRYAYRSACGAGLGGETTCAANTCPPGQQVYRLWQVSPGPAAPMGLVCSGNGPPPVGAAAAPPQVTEGMVLQAFRRIPLPSLRSHSQPANKTLINFDTIFFTDAQPLTRNLTLLGQRVRLEIKPSRFEWVHGDGTTDTTSTPGAPYPAKDVVYRYADAHRTVQHRVVVTWSAEWSLNGGPLQPVNGTVTTAGPSTPLRIAEASPALSGSGH